MKLSSTSSVVDPWRALRDATDRHRHEHGCWAFPHAEGSVLGVLAAAVDARRILELGTALGYTALWLACGAKKARVDTLERDPLHVAMARAAIEKAGHAARIHVHEGEFAGVLPALQPNYDLAFFDGHAPTPGDLAELRRLLRPGGLLVSANQQLARPGSASYRSRLSDADAWLSAPLGNDMTLSVWLPDG